MSESVATQTAQPQTAHAPEASGQDSGLELKASMHAQPIRKVGEYEGNPIGLSEEACKAIAPELDKHLAAYNVLYHQYHKHHWLVVGPQFRDLHLFLEEHYQKVHEHMDKVAERLTVLGFVPTCSPIEQEKLSYIRHEPEGQFRVRTMLDLDLAAERKVSISLRETVKLCLEHGDFGTKKLLEKMLQHAEDRAHHLEHFLEEDSLAIGLFHDASDLK
ncbi:MAG: DNA starvation/stationary phase protection protein [Bacteroidota bacterium]